MLVSQLHFRHVDPQTGLFHAEHPAFQSLLHLVRDYPEFRDEYMGAGYLAFGQKDLAMVAGRFIGTAERHGITTLPTAQLSTPYGLNWDMVSYPVFVEAPDTGPAPAYYYLGIPKNSVRKNEAFQMISHMLTDGPQLANSRNGLASVRNDAAFINRFGELNSQTNGKNVGAFYYHQKEGTLGPEFDLDIQTYLNFTNLWSKPEDLYIEWAHGELDNILDYRREKLEKLGVTSDD